MARLDPPDPETYTADQKRVADAVTSTRGSIRGPFGVWLHAPGFADPAQNVGQYIRYRSDMPGNLRELAILTVGRHFQANYEWYAHAPIAIEEGIAAEAVERLRRGETPAPLSDDERLVHETAKEIVETGRLSDAAYANATALLGDAGLVELVGLCGYYSMIALTLNVFEVDVPDGKPPFPA